MTAPVLTVPARCIRGHLLTKATAILAQRTVRCALCDRSDCYRAQFGLEPPPEVLDPTKFRPVGVGITAAARATYLSETEPHQQEIADMPKADQRTPAADRRTQHQRVVDISPPPPRTTWRDFLNPEELPVSETEHMDVRDMGLESWQRSKAYMRWSHARGDFGID